ncbi:MAG: NADH-quinone oxidoreductase subunit [Dehalococcoidia bacterium]|nr:NADH-quinone oxidoreductase subunit [Dehalococcoidia bacterium]
MPDQYVYDYTAVFIAAIGGLAVVFLLLFVAGILAPRRPSAAKGQIYECGMLPIGRYWSQYHVRYYLFAILFMIFEVEVVFLFPWAVVLKIPAVGAFAFYEMIIFIAILLFGLAYAWKKGVLEWS